MGLCYKHLINKVLGKYFEYKVNEGTNLNDKYIHTVAQLCLFNIGIY
jgi:hypothetical protein